MKRIGFATQYFTLWNVSKPYKHYFGTQKYDFEWRVDYQYLQNLSKDEEQAKAKAAKFGTTNLEVDKQLYGRSISFYTTGEKGSDRPDWEFPLNIHRYGIGDIRTAGQGRKLSDGRDDDFTNGEERKALWCLYLKKEIVFEGENRTRPDWARPIVYARRRMIELGMLVKYNGQWISPKYRDTLVEREKKQAILDSLEGGFLHQEKERIETQLQEIDARHFEGEYGEFYIITYRSSDNKLYKYMGSTPPQISQQEDEFTRVKGTVKHTQYKEEEQTQLQRITVIR